jgi:hypothetical protein
VQGTRNNLQGIRFASAGNLKYHFKGIGLFPVYIILSTLIINYMKPVFLAVCLAALVLPALSQNTVKVNECVIEKGVLKKIEVDYNMATGDRTITVNGVAKKFYDLYPQEGPEYAAKSTWYINSDPVAYNGASFVKYGLPRVLTPQEIEKTGAYKGIGVYTEYGMTPQQVKETEVIYIPVRSGCEFQPYQRELPPCGTVTVKANKEVFKAGDAIIVTATVAGADAATITYEWYVESGKIVGKGDGNKITVSTEKASADFVAMVTIRVPGKSCEAVNADVVVKIKK